MSEASKASDHIRHAYSLLGKADDDARYGRIDLTEIAVTVLDLTRVRAEIDAAIVELLKEV